MQTISTKLVLPEGTFNVDADHFNVNDLKDLKDIYDKWRGLSTKLKSFNARSVNLPEGLSEVSFCYFMNCVRLNNPKVGANVNTSFDAYSLTTNKRIQIKSCSVIPDLTSFGPKSQWDELYFQDFYRKGKWDYKVDVYLIPNELIYNQKVNKNQTFKDMQNEGKRPRFSIFKDIITEEKLQPVKTYSLK